MGLACKYTRQTTKSTLILTDSESALQGADSFNPHRLARYISPKFFSDLLLALLIQDSFDILS